MILDVPEAVRLRVRARGKQGEQWLDSLEERVAQLAGQWHCKPNRVLTGGSESLVLLAEREPGELVVIKLGLPGVCDCAHEARVLKLAAGAPYVSLLADDQETNALLLEYLGPRLADSQLGTDAQIAALCHTLREGWVNVPHESWLMTGGEKAEWLADFIDAAWRDLMPKISTAVRETALDYALRRVEAFTLKGSVLVHGDGHAHNALYALPPAKGLRLVDPDGLFAEPACDLAVPMRDWSRQLLAGDPWADGHRRARQIAALTDVDETAIWEWGFMERVSTGLSMLQLGMEKAGMETLLVAHVWCTDPRATA